MLDFNSCQIIRATERVQHLSPFAFEDCEMFILGVVSFCFFFLFSFGLNLTTPLTKTIKRLKCWWPTATGQATEDHNHSYMQ